MKMRELEQRTGVNREVIRILIREGLVPQPERPARNAAEYDERHVAAIAAVRQLQQTSRLTLKEIRGAMEGNGLVTAGPAAAYRQLEEMLAIRFDMREARMIPLASLEERYPKAKRDAEAFEQMGMLTIVGSDEGELISLADARLVEIWGQIREVGFEEETGFPPENISFYLKAAEMVAKNEADLFVEMSGGRIADDRAATMLHIALPLMLDFFGLLRIKAFMKRIHLFDKNY
jgi:DNA-binding transcriptional MerR regulator